MAYTIEQYNAITEAIATGSLTIKYADKEVTYRSLNDMIKIKGIIETELGIVPTQSRRKYASYSKGIFPTCHD